MVVMWIRFNSVEAVISPIMLSMPIIQSGDWNCYNTNYTQTLINGINTTFFLVKLSHKFLWLDLL